MGCPVGSSEVTIPKGVQEITRHDGIWCHSLTEKVVGDQSKDGLDDLRGLLRSSI